MPDEALEDSLRFLHACVVNCRQLDTFIGTTVQPVLESKLDALPYRRVCYTLLLRSRAWLKTLGKIDSPGEFQAASAACRSIFETAIDMVLIQHQEAQSVTKLLAWQRSCKLKYAQRVSAFSSDQQSADFIALHLSSIQEQRAQVWGRDRKGKAIAPDRWTGRNLGEDANVAERYHQAGFARFYAERYSTTCWFVHGSGVTGILEFPADSFPDVCAMSVHSACNFALVCLEYALKLNNAFDENLRLELIQLQETMGLTALALWRPEGLPVVSKT